ncbi:putative cysteine--tRNA ligase, mitochondrial [Armadillidium nasatum]|uniref:Putative cysteine--tRNA ligase, mitochondrial n=1 Tax=Armadillidium nasatum TaxID=96803 RepID=A0A5N5SUL5_9CRUS|nr:putative cysteine--tRNA ligase, mitochondrial [Armadillidium nasatum]
MFFMHNLFECFKSKYFVTKFVLSNQPRIYLRNYLLQSCRGNHTDLHWKEPDGYETGISIFNSLFPSKTLQPGTVTWYNCGPTVYDSAHIGHAVCYVKLDIIRRILQNIFHLDVIQVTGVTDIDDKILKKAQELNVNAKNLTQHYEKEFFHQMSQLNVLPPSVAPRVTENIPQIIILH